MIELIVKFALYVIFTFIFVILIIFFAMFIWFRFFEEKVKKFLKGLKSKKALWFYFILFGALSMGSSIIWFSLMSEIKKEIKSRYIAAFFFSRAIKPLLIPLQLKFLGLYLTIFINTYILAITPIASILTEKLEKFLSLYE